MRHSKIIGKKKEEVSEMDNTPGMKQHQLLLEKIFISV